MTAITRLASIAAACALALAPAVHAETVLRIVKGNELTALDPVASTATFARDHGFLVYDQLFAFDTKGRPKQQMVQTSEVSADGSTYTFTLREGLAFHDGAPVRAADAVASIKRWWQRDVVGRALASATAALEVVDDRRFTLRLNRPFALVEAALARPTASALFVMPERIAQTPAATPITDATGSGPFIFRGDAWRIGDRAVYVRNPAYRPRAEAPDGLAGGKVAKVDRIEWLAMPDAATVAGALANGEIDYWELPPADFIPAIERNPALRLTPINPAGSMIWLRMNHTQPPFNDVRMRRALLHAVNQRDVLDAAGIPEADRVDWCPAYFLCGTPNETAAGSEGFETPDLARGAALLKEAGYDGRPVVFLDSANLPTNHAATLVLAQAFQRMGLRMDVQALDFATVATRRNNRNPVDQGGWNLFITVATSLDAGDPLTNLYLAMPCEGGLAGWPCDQTMEDLRRSWWEERDEGKRRAILDAVQRRAWEVVPYANVGQFRFRAAVRRNIEGVQASTVPVFWGIEKK